MILFITLVVVFSNLFLGILTFSKNPKSATHRLLLILTFILAAWSVSNYFSVTVASSAEIFFWIKIVMMITASMFAVLFLLTRAYPTNSLNLSKGKLFFILVTILTTQLLVLFNLVFSRVDLIGTSASPIPGPGILFFALNVMGYLALSFFTLYKKNKIAQGREKVQFRFLIYGIVITFLLITFTNFILVNALKMTSLVAIGPSFTLILVGFISYAIIRHRFLDIGLIIARTLAFAILVILVGGIFSVAFFFIGALVFQITLDFKSLIFYSLTAFVVALTFQPLRRSVEQLTDKFFYKGRYDTNQVLSKIGNITSTDLELESLTSDILKTLTSEMRISGGALILFEEKTIYTIISVGFQNKFDKTYNEILPLLSYQKIQILDEVEEATVKELMRQLNISISKVLRVKDELVGLLVLREKLTGETYSEGDINILEIIAPEIAVAIQNSQSVDKIKRFNMTLREEVDRATRQLRVANSKLEELDRLKDDFVSVASHELRTPMTAIRSYAWMALYKADIPLSDKLKRYLSRTIISTERLINLVNEMLNISRIESGRIEIKPEIFNIASLVKDVFEEVSVKAAEKHIYLKMGSSANTPNIFADQAKVHQVLLNLIGNALKFTQDNGTIEVKFASNQTVVGIAVKDNGAGIALDDLHRLFKKFGRLENSYVTAGTTGGTGLGLYVCKSLVSLMGGEIWVQSEGVGKGSTFSFTLPIATKETLAHAEKYQLKPEGEAKVLEPVAI